MKKFVRPLMFVLIVALMLGLVGTSFAQVDQCFGLSTEDCDLYNNFSHNGEVPSSSAFKLDMNLAASVEESGTTQDFDMSLGFNGAYVTDEQAMQTAVQEFEDTPLLDVSPGTFLDLARGTLGSIDAQLEMNYEFPAEFGVPQVGPITVWLVDGVGYVDLSPFAAFDPSLEGVYGVNIIDLVETPLQQVSMGDILALFEGMGDSFAMMGDGGMMGADNMNPFSNFMPATMNPEDIAGAITLERVADDTVDGKDVAVFVMNVDVNAFFEMESMSSVIYQSALQSGMPDTISEADFAAAMAQAFDGSVVVTEKFDLETGTELQSSVNVDVTVDAAPIAALSGEETDGKVAMNMTWDFALSDVNNVDAIAAPEDAQVIPAEAIFGGL